AFKAVGSPAQFEFKLDGFRLQIHKVDGKIKLFTRRLEEVTKQFPEVVESIKHNVKGKEFILDSEAVGYSKKSGKYLPFQSISQRIKRKYEIERMSKDKVVDFYNYYVLREINYSDISEIDSLIINAISSN
ncbi:hypothetical protein IIA28_15600, partial [candidate division KSB1 bacterium]|nr:hypothetical protein [candidate division KSB1 bacterium]